MSTYFDRTTLVLMVCCWFFIQYSHNFPDELNKYLTFFMIMTRLLLYDIHITREILFFGEQKVLEEVKRCDK
jgi:hypothetical protein